MIELTPEDMAEAIERARYENMATARWPDLREAERATRVDLMRRSLTSSGVTAALAALQRSSDRAEHLADLVAQREAEVARVRTEHMTEVAHLREQLVELRAQLTQQIADVTSQLGQQIADVTAQLGQQIVDLQAELDQAIEEGAAATSRAEQAEDTIAAIRAAVGSHGAAHVPVSAPRAGSARLPAHRD